MNGPSFSDFPSFSKDRWNEQATKELKGKDFDTTLRWHLDEGITLDPYYTAAEVQNLPLAAMQAAQKQTPGWLNRVEIGGTDERTANQLAREALAGGADALTFDLRHQDPATISLTHLLDGLKLSDTPVTFRLESGLALFINELRKVAPYRLQGSLHATAAADWDEWATVFRQTDDSPFFRFATVHNATPVPITALVEVLTYTTEVLHQLTERGLPVERVLARLEFSILAGSDYLLELAKIRALRFLLHAIAHAYGIDPPTPFIHVTTRHAVPPATAPEFEDLIRTTTEAMAALAGGGDALTVGNHPEPDAFSRRMARNVSNLLRHEAQFARVADPAAGSYFLETLTYTLAEAAYTHFLAHQHP